VPRPGAKRGSEEWRRRVSDGARRAASRRRSSARIRPRDLDRLRRDAQVAAAVRPLLRVAEDETIAVIEDLGGEDCVSAQQRALVDDLAWLGLVLRTMMWIFVTRPDPDLASRIATLASARRANLVALGLERHRREVDLSAYLQGKAADVGAGNAIEPDPAPQDASTQDRRLGSVPDATGSDSGQQDVGGPERGRGAG
jgi:hypothetical protein